MDGVGGYSGWRWIFIIEGLLTVITTGIGLLCIPGYPKDSTFLNDEEKTYMLEMLEVLKLSSSTLFISHLR
jgi:MFS family permease